MTRNRMVLTLMLGLGAGLATLTDMVGWPYSTTASSAALSQATPTLSINDVSIVEGNSGTSSMVFTVTLTATGARPTIGVFYETADGTPPTGATAPTDYGRVSGPLIFPSGSGATTMTISVPINGDTSVEPDETFFVNLSRADGATITDAQGVGTITNDDAASLPVLSISSTSVVEGDTGTTDAVFTVSLSAASSSTVTVDYATQDFSATVADGDYLSRSGRLTFPAGDASSRTISVPVVGDTRIEESESFAVNLSNPVGATIGDGQGSCLIFTEQAEECSYSLSPMSQVFPLSGGVSSFNVGTTSSCRWSARTIDNWITITSGSGTGSGTVTFSIAANSIGDRTGFITINGTISFRVFQNDADSCFISLSETAINCYQQGCVGNLSVTAPSGCNWTAGSNAPWITIDSGASGSGTGSVGYTVAPNLFVGSNPGLDRTGTMTIAGQTITVSQDGCSLSVEPESQEVHYLAGTASISVFTGCDGWTAVSNDPWIIITAIRTDTLSKAVIYTYLENTGGRRTGTITIGNRTVNVTQIAAGPPCTVVLSPATGTASADGGAGSVSVNVAARCPWTAVADVPWITINTDDVSGAGSKSIRYFVDENDSGDHPPSRQGSIRVNGQAHIVFQDASDCPVSLICSFFPGVCQDDDQSTLGQSRAFRDKVLARSQRGQRYTQLYYKFSTEAVSTLMLNPMLLLRSREVMQRYMPVIKSMVRGEQVSLSQGDLDEIDSFLKTFSQNGSQEFRETLTGLSHDLRDPQVHSDFNITVTEGPRRELPAKDTLRSIRQTGSMMAPIGLLLFFLYRLRQSRKAE